MIKIKDIAAKCGVSIATVSKALNDRADLSEATQKKIKKIAQQMGYIPNGSARALKTHFSNNIGILFYDKTQSGLEHEYFSLILNSVKVAAEAEGFDITFISNRVGGSDLTYYQHALYRNCDGVILACVDYDDKEILELVNSGVPVVTIDHISDNKQAVLSDNSKGMAEIMNYVYSKGHRKIAFIHGEMNEVTESRLEGFYKAAKDFNLNIPKEYVKEGVFHLPKASGRAVRELLALDDRPTCILFPDDYSLLGGLTEIEKHGLRVPEDISIVGYDGIKLSRLLRPELTTYVQNTERHRQICRQETRGSHPQQQRAERL
jgi:Transcriptional regulators